jgi:hypothetical protein
LLARGNQHEPEAAPEIGGWHLMAHAGTRRAEAFRCLAT